MERTQFSLALFHVTRLEPHDTNHGNYKNNKHAILLKELGHNKLLKLSNPKTAKHRPNQLFYVIYLTLSGALRPKCCQAFSVATLPLGVLTRKPSRTKYGSQTVSTVSDSSPTIAAKLLSPTGPPLN